MAITQTQVDSLKRFIGQGEIYLNCKKPDDMTALTLTGGVPKAADGTTDATSVGLTNGPASLEYKPEFAAIEVEQAFGEIAPRLTKESVTLKFKCAEATYDRIQAALSTSTLVSVAGAGANPTSNVLTVGGKIDAATQCVVLVSKIGSYSHMSTTVDLYEWVCLYEAMSVDGVKLDWKRGENRMVEVTITGYADVTRSEGDQLFQLGQLAQPAP
jgi:hypothetical protein